jgi:hypothetical protein
VPGIRLKWPHLLVVALFALTLAQSVFADDLEGVYQDGPWQVSIRRQADGQYQVERRGRIGGQDVVQKSQGQVKNGRLIVNFQKGEIRSQSLSNRLGVVSGSKAKDDILIKPFEILVKDAAKQRIRALPADSTQGNENPATPSNTTPDSSSTGAGQNTKTTSTATTAKPTAVIRADTPQQAPASPFLAGLAVAAAVAAAAAASQEGKQKKTSANKGSAIESNSQALDLQSGVAKRELEILNAIAQDESATTQWQEPKLVTEADLRRLTGKAHGALSSTEKMILEYTNLQIMEGGADNDLAKNLDQVKKYRPKTFTETDARSLDGSSSKLLSPIEAEVLRYTNQQIVTGGSNVDLRANYRQFLTIYQKDYAQADAEAIYKAIDGAGTDEDAVINTLRGKSKDQIALLSQAFDKVLQKNGESTARGDYDTALHSWIDGDLDRGWYDKAIDAYNGKVVKEDADYFWASSAAKSWNQYIKDSDSGAKSMIQHGNLAEQGIGHVNQWIFGGARAVNGHVTYAQEFYMQKMAESDSGTVRFLSKTGFVLASIGGSFGTKALDPTLDYHQTEEGLIDLALLIGTFGAGKVLQAGAKTAVGARALTLLSKNLKHLSRLSYGLKRLTGVAGSSAKLGKRAKQYRDLAAATKNSQRAEQALKAAEKFEAAALRASKAEAAVLRAKKLDAAARQATKAGQIEEANRLSAEAIKASQEAKRSVEALRLAESSAKALVREASLLNNNALGRAYDGTKATLTRPAFNQAKMVRTLSGKMDDAVSADVAKQLKKLVDGRIGRRSGKMTGAEFNKLMDDLDAFAKKNGITISRTTETVGVFPKGLYEIQLAGFGKMKSLTDTVSFAKRHELAHIVHTLQTRATIARSLSPNGARLAGQSLKQAEEFLKAMEGGSNYRQFEKAVTGISSAAHLSDRAADVGLYANRVDKLIDGTKNGLHAGKMRFANGRTLEEVYAFFLSKAPAIVGTGLKDLTMRFPPILFATFYGSNMDASYYFDPRDYGIDPGSSGSMGFRDFINRLVAEGYHPDPK